MAEAAGKTQLLMGANGALQGIDPESGQVIWWCKSDGDSSSPVFKDNIAYIDSGRGSNGIAVDITGMGDVSKTHLKWRTEKPIPESLSSAVIWGDYIFVSSPDANKSLNLICLNRKDGSIRWQKEVASVCLASQSNRPECN